MSLDVADAVTLRRAARVLESRAKRKTFSLRVIIRVLERTADRLERGADEDEYWVCGGDPR